MNYQYPLIEVIWDDAASGSGWHEAKEVKFEPQIVVTVGFLIAENNKYIIIGHTYSEGDYVGDFQIPKGMIVSRKVLKRATKGKPNAD
jgi:hypothetical protein